MPYAQFLCKALFQIHVLLLIILDTDSLLWLT